MRPIHAFDRSPATRIADWRRVLDRSALPTTRSLSRHDQLHHDPAEQRRLWRSGIVCRGNSSSGAISASRIGAPISLNRRCALRSSQRQPASSPIAPASYAWPTCRSGVRLAARLLEKRSGRERACVRWPRAEATRRFNGTLAAGGPPSPIDQGHASINIARSCAVAAAGSSILTTGKG